MFETGTNAWRTYDQWPPPNTETRSLYLHEKGKLAFTPPPATATTKFDSYVSDPWKPVPYTAQIRTSEGNFYTVEELELVVRRAARLLGMDVAEDAMPLGLSLLDQVYELRSRQDVPAEVAIDEAVEAAKELCSAEAPGFVNGILGTVARQEAAR